jgi:hypothetical protein
VTATPVRLTSRLAPAIETLATWGPALAVILALLYGAGFLIVNTYLGSFGIRDLEPLRTRYVATGLCFVGLTILSAAFATRTHDAISAFGRDRRPSVQIGAVLLNLPLTLAFTGMILLFVLSSLRASFWPLEIPRAAVQLIDIGIFVFGTLIVVLAFRARRNDWHTTLGGVLALLTVGSLTAALLAYANTIYPSLPTSFGGGRPEEVMLVLDKDETCPTCWAGVVRLLDDDGNRVVVLVETPDGRRQAVEITRAAVRSITHRPITPR